MLSDCFLCVGITEEDLFNLDPSASYNVMVDSRGRKIIVKEFYSASPSSKPDPSSPSVSLPDPVDTSTKSSLVDRGTWEKVSLGTTGDVLDIEEKVRAKCGKQRTITAGVHLMRLLHRHL